MALLWNNIGAHFWVHVASTHYLSKFFILNFVITIFGLSLYKSLGTYYDSY
jgi:hypothetical protein